MIAQISTLPLRAHLEQPQISNLDSVSLQPRCWTNGGCRLRWRSIDTVTVRTDDAAHVKLEPRTGQRRILRGHQHKTEMNGPNFVPS